MTAKAPRLYVPLDVGFFDDDKVIDAGEQGGWLYLSALARAKGLDTDGILNQAQLSRLGISNWRRRVDRDIDAGLFVRDGSGVYIPTYSKWNELRAEREARLEAERKRKSAARARAVGMDDRGGHGDGTS